MIQKDLADILNVLGKMREHELAMAELYRVFGQVWPVDKEFWTEMEQAEIKHAQNIEKITELVLKRPESFRLGRSLKPVAIETAISGVRSDIERLKKGKLPLYKALFTSRDIEQSVIENKYGEIVKTDDVEFKFLMNEVTSDTRSHLDRLNRKIKEWSG
jgi:hypothetical protein